MASLFGWFRRAKGRGPQTTAFEVALAAHQRGDLDAAVAGYDEVLRAAPTHIDALNNLAGIHGQRGEWQGALELLEQARAVEPGHVGVLVNLGNLYRMNSRIDDAQAAYRQALAHAPDDLDALRALGLLLLDANNPQAALPLLEQARERAPQLAQCHYDAGVAHGDCDNLETAIERYHSALAIDPDHFPSYVNLGNALRQLDRIAPARAAAEQAVALAPDSAIALDNLAGVLGSGGDPADGLPYVERALKSAPDDAGTLGNHGALLAALGEYAKARAALTRALEIDPAAHDARFTLASVDLVQGHLRSGWHNYEAGLHRGARASPQRGYPRWQGNAIPGGALLILPEQGVGDEIMFASCIAQTLERSQAARCVFECDPRLKPLMERSIPGLGVPAGPKCDDASRLHSLAPFDYEIPVGSLAQWVRPEASAFPSDTAFLMCDAQRVAAYQSRLAALGAGLKIGISWKGGHDTRTRRSRTIELEQWSSILAAPGVHFINLQYGDTHGELAAVHTRQQVTVSAWPEPDPLVDLDGFAALTKALDLVISIDNSTVHIAGSVGTPTWIMLPQVPDWRWGASGETTPWYGSVRLFRQQTAGDWSPVIDTIASALRGLADAEARC